MTNPLLQPFTGDFALPPFDRIEDAHFAPAFEAALAVAPSDPNVIYAGFASEARRSELVRGAEAVVIPGKLDSLSLSLLEAWAQGIPTLSTSQCPVKSGHARRARAGYEFGPERSFASALETLLSDPNERERSVAAGRAYVRDNYAWPSVLERFMTLARYVADAN